MATLDLTEFEEETNFDGAHAEALSKFTGKILSGREKKNLKRLIVAQDKETVICQCEGTSIAVRSCFAATEIKKDANDLVNSTARVCAIKGLSRLGSQMG